MFRHIICIVLLQISMRINCQKEISKNLDLFIDDETKI